MSSRLPTAALLLAVTTLFACGESHGDEDTGISFDAMMPPDGSMGDGASDAPMPPASDVGSACESASMCDEICIEEDMGFPGGYCTAECSVGDCPDGSVCTQVGRGYFLCLDECDPSSEERTCRAGYGCASSFMLEGPVCIPGCYDDTDCPSGLTCNPDGGFAGEGSCYDAGASIGDACMDELMCPADSFCLGERFSGWPGGACIRGGCDPDAGSGCDTGEVCLPAGRGGACFAGCSSDTDCRSDYRCAEFDDDRSYCAPGCTDDSQCSGGRVCNPALGTCDVPFDASDIGRECSTTEDVCDGGTCLTEFESGFPFSYCVYVGCDPTAAPGASGCPGDAVCAPGAGDLGVCVDACEDSLECTRDGYDCLPSDRSDSSSPTACMPACTTDASCANMGFVCNEGTGLCRMDFDPADLGEPCETPDDCTGGVCIREADEGWPAGTCTYPGCRLSGTGPSETCPSGSVCVDDEAGNPEIGVCMPACSTTTSSCRPGYTCVVEGSATDGHCGPSCTTDVQCTGSRVCDIATGLCG